MADQGGWKPVNLVLSESKSVSLKITGDQIRIAT